MLKITVNFVFLLPTFRALSDADAFLAFVGADQKSYDLVQEDPCGLNRARVSEPLLGLGHE